MPASKTVRRSYVLFLDELALPRERIAAELKAALAGVDSAHELEPIWLDDPRARCAADQVLAVVTSRHEVNEELIGRWPNVLSVSGLFTGFNGVDDEYLDEHGIHIEVTPGYATASVAELNVAMILCSLRGLHLSDASVRRGDFDVDAPGVELEGKTVSIIGHGDIGWRTAQYLRPFGVELIGWSRNRKPAFEKVLGGSYVSWSQAFERADVVVLQMALNSDTENRVGARELAWLRDGALVVNSARAGLIEPAALERELRSGRLLAALDVHPPEQEVRGSRHPLADLSNVLLSGHLGFKTTASLRRLALRGIANVGKLVQADDRYRAEDRLMTTG